MNTKLLKGAFWGVVLSIPLWAVIIAGVLSVNALADFTVGRTMTEPFQMYNPDLSPRTNCNLTKFSAETWLNDSRVAMSWTFRNQSTGDYDAIATPATPGDYKLAIFYDNTMVGTYTDTARLWDIDTMYGSAGPRMSNLSTATARNGAAIAGIPTTTYGNRFTNSSTAIARGFSAMPANVWGAATRTLTAGGGGTVYVNVTGINNYLTAQHGSGLWSAAGTVSVLPFQGAASYETVAQGEDVHVTHGDSVAIPYSIGTNITGYTVWFGVKTTPQDSAYAIAPRDITAYVTNASTGSGLINLSTTDTALPVRKYAAQVEIKNRSTVNTVLKFNLFIDASVLN